MVKLSASATVDMLVLNRLFQHMLVLKQFTVTTQNIFRDIYDLRQATSLAKKRWRQRIWEKIRQKGFRNGDCSIL